MWGCTLDTEQKCALTAVFPTHVGVYRETPYHIPKRRSFPHACGGVPGVVYNAETGNEFSPRMWGCTAHTALLRQPLYVFPTHVGVYLSGFISSPFIKRFPHACGGVPEFRGFTSKQGSVFPTHVGVYLYGTNRSSNLNRFPHACGGVPRLSPRSRVKAGFSPRMWGCTFVSAVAPASAAVFPTHVGVYHMFAAAPA